MYAALRFSYTSRWSGSTAAFTSALMAMPRRKTSDSRALGSQAASRSATAYSKNRDWAPVPPSEPISSLSQNSTSWVCSGVFSAKRAWSAAKTQERSSWP